MQGNDLKQGIAILYDMEKNNYFMTRTITLLDVEISKLGHKANILSPKKKIARGGGFDLGFGIGGIGAIIGAIIGIIYTIVYVFTSSWNIILKFFALIWCGLCMVVIGGIVGFIIGLILGAFIGAMSDVKRNEKLEQQYSNDISNYKKRLKNDENRVNKELKKKQALIRQRNDMVQRLSASEKKLNEFYDIVNIDYRFRNLIPIGYMNELISLNISDNLYGVNGLYALVRKDLKDYQISCSLKNISEKLDLIIENQQEIKSELKQMNNTCDNILAQSLKSTDIMLKNNTLIDRIARNTELAAYNTERIACEESYQSFLLTFKQ